VVPAQFEAEVRSAQEEVRMLFVSLTEATTKATSSLWCKRQLRPVLQDAMANEVEVSTPLKRFPLPGLGPTAACALCKPEPPKKSAV
jgi:hypothetical protein